MSRLEATAKLFEKGLGSLVPYTRRGKKLGEKKDTFRYQGKTYPKSEGVRTRYKSKRRASGFDYNWSPKNIKGRVDRTRIRETEYAKKQVAERKLIKDKLGELDVEDLKKMHGYELQDYIKNTLNLGRTRVGLQDMQREVVGGGWKGLGRGQKKEGAGPDHFMYFGKSYPRSEGVKTPYTTKIGGKAYRWTPKAVKGQVGKANIGKVDPVLAAERESMKKAMEGMDKETLKKMSGNELLAAVNKITKQTRKDIPYKIREEVIGGGWKPRKGTRLIGDKHVKWSGINSLSPENFEEVGAFTREMTRLYPAKRTGEFFNTLIDRMIKFAKRKGVPEEQIIKKLYETDIAGIGNIIVKDYELKKLWKEAKALGLNLDRIDLSHIDAVSRNWEKALDPSNLFFAKERLNRYLQSSIEKQINILKEAIPRAKSLADKKIMATSKVVLDPKHRKKHLYEYYKPRTLAEAREDLAKADLVSEIGGTRYGAKIDPNDPYFAEKIAARLRAQIAKRREEINLQAARTTLNRGGLVNGYSKGGRIIKHLDDAIGMMSRRKFLKGMGATAASAAIPKSALKLAPAALKKGALNFAPPWVNGMLASLKSVKDLGALGQRRSVMGGGMSTGNDAKIINLGTKNIKVFKDQEAKITYFKIKTRDEKVADDMAKSKGEKTEGYWDDVELREEPGQTTITWKNKEYDGNDQHVVIDKISKETRFVDDNWHMEAGGEDIAKDDWMEWAITPNKSKTAKSLKKTVDEIDDAILDGQSVNDMDNHYADMFRSYVDSFSPAGNIFGTPERMVKKIIKRDALRKEKIYNDQQVRNLKEKEMLDWEEQFRGGKGMHAYNRGGMSMSDYPRHNLDMDRVLDSMSFVESTNNPSAIGSRVVRTARDKKYPQDFDHRKQQAEKARGQYQILPSTARQPGYGVTAWPNFSDAGQWDNPDLSRDFSKRYLTGLLNHNKGNWFAALSQYGGVKDPSDSTYWDLIMNQYNKGGIARRPNAVPPEKGPDPYGTFIDESVSQVMNSPSEFMGSQFIQKFNKGGFVKKNAPKVIGKLTNYKPKLTMSDILKNIKKTKKAKPSANPYIIYDQALTPLKKFKTRNEAQTWLNRNYTADSNIHPEVVHYEKAKTTLKSMEPKAEEPGALFWGSREKIIGAPSEAMTGTQWLQYMKIGKHGILNPKGYPRIKDMELNDTSLAPWLSRQGNKTVSKDVLVKQFDAMAPKMEVTVLGETTGSRIISDLSSKLKEVDTQAIRNPAIKGFFDYVKAVMPQLKESTTDDAAKGILKGIDDMVFNNFGVKDALTEGVPQRFPFEMKEVLQQLSTALGRRTAGFKTYKRTPQHLGTQTMAGGDNYREFLFKYKPGSLRQTEPQYKYAHDFNLETADRMGGVVHARTSDRADQFGRRLLHIEEIQSDMHQKVNMAQRQLKKMHSDWAKAGKTPEGEYKKMTKNQKETYDKLVASGKYAPRGDLQEEIATANEQHLLLVQAKIEDLLMQKQTPAIRTRINRLNAERRKIRKMIDDEKAKMAEGSHSGVPQGPLSKTEDYNEFIMKYMLKVAREGGYDGITINTPAIKNLGMSVTGRDYKGNLIAYGPMAQGAMKKAANKSGAKFMKTYIVDDDKRAWEVPMILIKENKAAESLIDKGLPIYKKGGIVKK